MPNSADASMPFSFKMGNWVFEAESGADPIEPSASEPPPLPPATPAELTAYARGIWDRIALVYQRSYAAGLSFDGAEDVCPHTGHPLPGPIPPGHYDAFEEAFCELTAFAATIGPYPDPNPFCGPDLINLAGVLGSSCHRASYEAGQAFLTVRNAASLGFLPSRDPARPLPGFLALVAAGDGFRGMVPGGLLYEYTERLVVHSRTLFATTCRMSVSNGPGFASAVGRNTLARANSLIATEVARLNGPNRDHAPPPTLIEGHDAGPLRKYAEEELKGNEQRVIRELCLHEGTWGLANFKSIFQWTNEQDDWKKLQSRVNDKIKNLKPLAWRLAVKGQLRKLIPVTGGGNK